MMVEWESAFSDQNFLARAPQCRIWSISIVDNATKYFVVVSAKCQEKMRKCDFLLNFYKLDIKMDIQE